jgi:hypothetical protein
MKSAAATPCSESGGEIGTELWKFGKGDEQRWVCGASENERTGSRAGFLLSRAHGKKPWALGPELATENRYRFVAFFYLLSRNVSLT